MNIYALIPLLTSIFYLIILIFAMQQASKGVGKYFIYYLSVAAFWSFTSFMTHLSAPPSRTLFWNELLVVALVWTLVSYFHFTLVYSEHRVNATLISAYTVLALVAILSLGGHVITYAHVINGVYDHGLFTWAKFAIAITGSAFSILIIRVLIIRYRNSTDPISRNRTMYLISGWCVLVLLTYTNLVPVIANWPLDHVGSLVNALLISYAISQYHLFDIKFVARTTLAYLITASFIGGIFAGSILLVYHNFSDRPLTGIILFAVVLVLIMAAISRPIKEQAQKLVDRVFYFQTYHDRLALQSFSAKMGYILDLDQLAQEMLPTICKVMDISWAGLMLQDDEKGDFNLRYVSPVVKDKPRPEYSLNADSLIISWLEKNNQPLDPERMDAVPEFRGLWQTEREQIMKSGLGLLYPMKSRDRVICILALGKKRMGRLYLHEDLQVVASIASQAGVIIENAQLYTQATTRANTDELTGLYNHRHFHERLEQEIARGSRFGNVFSLILIDIDLFKSYNDIYGHLAGDQVLRKVGRSIATSIRGIDLAFRYGGEEFAVILPEARLDDGYKVAERIRKTIESKTSSRSMPITASLGIASWPNDGVMKEEVINRADAALYRAKQLGRNQTCLSTDSVKTGQNIISLELEAQPKALSIIYALAATVDAKDSYTYGHSRKVSEYAVLLGEALNLPQEKVGTLRAAGLLHDIGKVGVPDSILTKKSALTQAEWTPIKTHPGLGVEILKHVIDLVNCLPAIQHHHEHYDGTGYPSGTAGDKIPFDARILAIADAYDAMTSPRPYRTQVPLREALLELKRCAGSQFDPEMVETFCTVMTAHLEGKPGAEIEKP